MSKSQLIIIGGANGSGKTTLAREFVEIENIDYLGADDIARELNPNQPELAAIEAARLFSQRLGDYLKLGESLIVESTLSGLSLRKWIQKARDDGYSIKILFVYLDSAELCIQRVSIRVRKGGHHVPEEDVRRRYSRSNENFWNIYRKLADDWSLYYNSGEIIVQIAFGDAFGTVILEEARFEKWLKMVN